MRRSQDYVIEIYLLLAALANFIMPLQSCPHPNIPFKGSYLPKSENFLPGDKVTFFCEKNYTLIGRRRITCRSNGHWLDPAPFCDLNTTPRRISIVNDERESILAPELQDGNLSTCVTLTSKDAIYFSLADPGFLYAVRFFIGKGIVFFDIRKCGTMSTKFDMEEKWTLMHCDKDYGLVDSVVIDIAVAVKVGSLILCEMELFVREEDNCRRPPDIKDPNGYIEFNRSIAILSCENDFKSANTRLVCERGSWYGAKLQCEEENPVANETAIIHSENICQNNSDCPATAICDPLERKCKGTKCEELKGTAMLNIHYTQDREIGSYATFHCFPPAKSSGVPFAKCLENLSWSDPPPTCDTTGCPPISAVNAPLKVILQPPVTAIYSCPSNYSLSGEAVSFCVSGKWSSNVPVCQPKCPILSSPDNGRLKFSSSDLVDGLTAEIICLPGYQVLGQKILTCTAGGNWSHDLPLCVEACAVPPIPTRGFVRYLPPTRSNLDQISETYLSRIQQFKSPLVFPSTSDPANASLPAEVHRVGTGAMFGCESRYYKLVGSRTRWCQEKGEWSGTASFCIPVCGHSNSPRSPVIVNGNSIDIGEWPWQAGIARYSQEYRGWYLVCGASLLNELWVITAAHCVTYLGTTLILEEDKFRVYLGKYHRDNSKDDEYVQVRKVQTIRVHPDYQPALLDSDIALIKLDLAVQLNSRVQPICLPTEKSTRDNLIPGKRGVVTGWGLNENETHSEALQQAVLPVVSHETCEKGYEESGIPQTLTDNMFCAGYAQGKINACSGDSGGPMVFPDESSKEKKWILEGIVSWASPEGCGNPNQYAGFTIVSIFLDWIYLYL